MIALLLLTLGLATADTCLDCHEKETPGVVKPWAESAHAPAKVGCARCHGDDYDLNHPKEGGQRDKVGIEVCAPCHASASEQHRASRHAIGFRAGQGCTRNMPQTAATVAECGVCHESDTAEPRTQVECARFLGQSPAMQRQGCMGCHTIEDRCDTCHTPHDTDLAIARDPAICATCHMGPDHPQWEAWKTSKHGILWASKGPDVAPDCARCHMPNGTHDVGFGLSMGLAGQPLPEDLRDAQRADMIGMCADCHTPGFAARNLADGDAIQKESKALLVEASTIIQKLDAEGLLWPSPQERPPHPLSGRNLELGPQMVYQDLSRVEAIYFRMKKFSYVMAWKGAFHNNPDYAHWYGNAPLKLQLSEIKSEAELLRAVARLDERIDLLSGSGGLQPAETSALKRDLRALKDRFLRGEIDEATYQAERDRALDDAGL